MYRRSTDWFSVLVLCACAFVFVVAAGAFFASCQPLTSPKIKAHAEVYALRYTQQFLNGNPTSVVDCMGVDSDNNGYVTCTVASERGGRTTQIECVANAWLEWNTGCRAYMQRTISVQQQ